VTSTSSASSSPSQEWLGQRKLSQMPAS